MKWFGVCLLLSASIAMGLLLGANYRSRIRELEQWTRVIKHLEREICFEERVLAESFATAALFANQPIATLFTECSRQMTKENMSFAQAWQSSWKAYLPCSNLTVADRQILQDFMVRVGKGDMENQKRVFDFLYKQLDDMLYAAKESCATREKICRCLVWAGGAALALIFY